MQAGHQAKVTPGCRKSVFPTQALWRDSGAMQKVWRLQISICRFWSMRKKTIKSELISLGVIGITRTGMINQMQNFKIGKCRHEWRSKKNIRHYHYLSSNVTYIVSFHPRDRHSSYTSRSTTVSSRVTTILKQPHLIKRRPAPSTTIPRHRYWLSLIDRNR